MWQQSGCSRVTLSVCSLSSKISLFTVTHCIQGQHLLSLDPEPDDCNESCVWMLLFPPAQMEQCQYMIRVSQVFCVNVYESMYMIDVAVCQYFCSSHFVGRNLMRLRHSVSLCSRCGVSLPSSPWPLRPVIRRRQEGVCGKLSGHRNARPAAGYLRWWIWQLRCWLAVRPDRTVRFSTVYTRLNSVIQSSVFNFKCIIKSYVLL